MFWNELARGESRRELWTPFNDCEPLPVLAMRGAHDGPTFLAAGGVHGDEYEGPFAIAQWFARLDASQLRGRVLALPIVNTEAWHAKSRNTPRDNADLNRAFNANKQGHTARLAEAVFTSFASSCDALCDLHSGGAALVHLPLLGWYENDERAQTLARRAEPALHPWQIPNAPGVLSHEAHRIGKLSWGAEWGGGARLDLNGASAYERALTNLAAQLGMLDAPLPAFDTRAAIAGDYQSVERDGLFAAGVQLGERVESGATLGHLHDLATGEVAPVLSARSGIVAGLASAPLLKAGNRIAYVG